MCRRPCRLALHTCILPLFSMVLACCKCLAPSIRCCCSCASCLPKCHLIHMVVPELELLFAGAGQHSEHGLCGGTLFQRAGCVAEPSATEVVLSRNRLRTSPALSAPVCTAVQASREAGALSMGGGQQRHMTSRSG